MKKQHIQIGDEGFIFKGFANDIAETLVDTIKELTAMSPLRQMTTKRGYQVKAEMTSCGHYGWVSDKQGYRYELLDPLSQQPWPDLPEIFQSIAASATGQAGFDHFKPDACLINHYQPGVGMGLHQDKDELDLSHPIVSISLGVPAIFIFGGMHRNSEHNFYLLEHGDVAVWGGKDRLRYHGIKPLKLSHHPLTKQSRYNLTLRKTGYIS